MLTTSTQQAAIPYHHADRRALPRRLSLSLLCSLGFLGATSNFLVATQRPARGAARHLDLEDPWDNLEGYLKARSDVSGRQSISWTSGMVWSSMPGRKAQVLMMAHGLKCTRCIKDKTGYEFLERECVIFSDPKTLEPISTWFNPFTERTVDVFHIRNASAGGHIDANGADGPFRMNYMEHSGDVTFYDDLFYAKPSALNLQDYSPYAASNVYEGAGIYHFHVKRADLDNPYLTSVPVTTSHTGIRQWLPWMEMGAWPGGVVLPSRGKKLQSVMDIPRSFLTWLERNSPEFLEAPTLADKDNQKFFYQHFREHIDSNKDS